MRAACAFCLCKALCANDPEAAKVSFRVDSSFLRLHQAYRICLLKQIIEEGLLQNSLPNIFDSSFPDGAFGGGTAGRTEVNMWSFFLFFNEGDEDGGNEEGGDHSDGEEREVTDNTAQRSGDGSGGAIARGAETHRSNVVAEPRIVRLSDVTF
jgi:hypothetical protein